MYTISESPHWTSDSAARSEKEQQQHWNLRVYSRWFDSSSGQKPEPLHDFRPNKQLDEAERIIDVVCCHPGYERVLFGQKKNCLYQMNAHDKASTTIVSRGHPGIREIFVKDKNVITVGANIIKIRDAKQHRISKVFPSRRELVHVNNYLIRFTLPIPVMYFC
jgi:hypothetical protein